MKRFYLNACELDKWMEQNEAEAIDCVEGCLIDSLLVLTKHGVTMLKEHYVNSNCSDYEVTFARSDSQEDVNEVYDLW